MKTSRRSTIGEGLAFAAMGALVAWCGNRASATVPSEPENRNFEDNNK